MRRRTRLERLTWKWRPGQRARQVFVNWDTATRLRWKWGPGQRARQVLVNYDTATRLTWKWRPGQRARDDLVNWALRFREGYVSKSLAGLQDSAELKISQDSYLELVNCGRVGDPGMEQGLREAGLSDESICVLCRLDQSLEVDFGTVDFDFTEDDRASFFSLVGRSISSTVKSLDLGYRSLTSTELEHLCVNLSSNDRIETLKLRGNSVVGTVEGCTLLGEALRSNSALQSLLLDNVEMDSEAVKCLLDGLQGTKSLLSLELSNNDLYDKGIVFVAEFLKDNATLKKLDIRCTGYQQGADHMRAALQVNATLEELWFGGGVTDDKRRLRESLKRMLEPLSRDVGEVATSTNGPKNTTLKSLQFTTTFFYVEDVAWLIRTNEALSTLRLQNVNLLPIDWKKKIIHALNENKTLKELDLSGSRGLNRREVQDDLMDVLRTSNTGLARIDLSGTDMESWQGRVDEELRINEKYRGTLRGEQKVAAKSGRLILCGYGYAGKTAICNTMKRIEHGTPWSHPFKMGWKKFMQRYPSLRQILHGKNAYKELMSRTRGFDVVTFRDQPYLKAIWDFAGQREYYALHDYLFPDIRNSCFLYVCSCRCQPDPQNLKGAVKSRQVMKDECAYWLKFIASNSKSVKGGHNPQQKLPRVRFVMTNKDTLSSSDLETSKRNANQTVRELREVFHDVLDLCGTVEVVNAHSSKDMKHLLNLTNQSLKEQLTNQTEYLVCEEIRAVLSGCSANNQSKPVMSVKEFYNIRRGRFFLVGTPMPVREALLPYLNDLGEIIFLKGFDFIVTNPRWFGVHVLGSLIAAFKGEGDYSCHRGGLAHVNGYVDRRDMKFLLEKSLQIIDLHRTISCDKMIELMIHLELCFEKEEGNVDSSLFLPALFDDDTETAGRGIRKLEWRLAQTGNIYYLGRRLECEEKDITFLTPGFFPRLQVHLRNYFHERGWTANFLFAVDRNLICFAENGIEVLVEYSGDIDYFVDILVRSAKPFAEALKFIHEHVVGKILQFAASPQGCQGVLLLEAVIRPQCVEDLDLCKDRKYHSVLVTTLKERVDKDRGFLHIWENLGGNGKHMDLALDLLEGKGSYDSYLAANQVDVDPTEKPRLRDFLGLKQELPKLFYPTIDDVGLLPKLNNIIAGGRMKAVKLHLMCEERDCNHSVRGQKGRTLELNWNSGGYNLPIMRYAIALAWAGVSLGTSFATSGAGSFVFPPIDNLIQSLFNEHKLPIPMDKLAESVNHRKSDHRLSDQEIKTVLDKYMKIDPSTQWLKNFLNLQDSVKFHADFGLHKVRYTDKDTIAWLCQACYLKRLEQRIVISEPY